MVKINLISLWNPKKYFVVELNYGERSNKLIHCNIKLVYSAELFGGTC